MEVRAGRSRERIERVLVGEQNALAGSGEALAGPHDRGRIARRLAELGRVVGPGGRIGHDGVASIAAQIGQNVCLHLLGGRDDERVDELVIDLALGQSLRKALGRDFKVRRHDVVDDERDCGLLELLEARGRDVVAIFIRGVVEVGRGSQRRRVRRDAARGIGIHVGDDPGRAAQSDAVSGVLGGRELAVKLGVFRHNVEDFGFLLPLERQAVEE